jgi:hypothetical protein
MISCVAYDLNVVYIKNPNISERDLIVLGFINQLSIIGKFPYI